MHRPTGIEIALSLCAGLLIGVVGVTLLSYTLAIAVPSWLLDHSQAEGNAASVLRWWDGLVVYLLAVGLPAFVVCLVLFKLLVKPGWGALVAVLAGFLGHVHIVSPLMAGDPILVPEGSDFAWYGALLANAIVGIALGAFVMRSKAATGN